MAGPRRKAISGNLCEPFGKLWRLNMIWKYTPLRSFPEVNYSKHRAVNYGVEPAATHFSMGKCELLHLNHSCRTQTSSPPHSAAPNCSKYRIRSTDATGL